MTLQGAPRFATLRSGTQTVRQAETFRPERFRAYWSDFNWGIAIQKGMEYAGMEYSGKYGFVETEMYWPISHMVSQKEDALGCVECHARNGRLKNLSGFYLPGRDTNPIVEITGLLVIVGSLFGVMAHAIMRYLANKKSLSGGAA